MTRDEQMIACAERAVEAATDIMAQAQRVIRDATATARTIRENGGVPINQSTWFISPQDVSAVNIQSDTLERIWTEGRDEARAERLAAKQS